MAEEASVANADAAKAAAKVAEDEKQMRLDEQAAGPPAAIAQQKQAALNSANQVPRPTPSAPPPCAPSAPSVCMACCIQRSLHPGKCAVRHLGKEVEVHVRFPHTLCGLGAAEACCCHGIRRVGDEEHGPCPGGGDCCQGF